MDTELSLEELVDHIDMDRLASLLAEHINYSDLSEHLDYSAFDLDYSEFDLDYSEFDLDYSALGYEIDYSEFYIDYGELYEHVDDSALADIVLENISYDCIADNMLDQFKEDDEFASKVASEVEVQELARHVQDPWSLMVTPFHRSGENK